MDKAAFKKDQPAAATFLSRMLKEGHIPNALLLWGPAGAPLAETARLFAASLLCEHVDEDGFACGKCLSCREVEQSAAPTLFVADRPRKSDITRLQDRFSLTSDTQKVSILENFDGATLQAANSLLKFLEEPQPGITHILTTSNKGGLLPTIESRCLRVPLRPASLEMRKSRLVNLPEDIREAAACAGHVPEEFEENAFYEKLGPAAISYMEDWSLPRGLYDLQRNVFPAKGADTTRANLKLFFEVLLWNVKRCGLSPAKKAKVVSILMEGIEQMKRAADPALCLDQTASRIRKGINYDEYE